MPIITISRQFGSLGDQIARATADALGYRYVEKSEISETLADFGFSIAELDKYDEKKPSIWRSLSVRKEQFAHLIQAAVYELAAANNAVIVGRGGQVILKDVPGTLHIRIVAPYETRFCRLVKERGYEKNDAQRALKQSDRDSAGYLHTYFDADWNHCDQYDLVLNTRSIMVSDCIEIIARAVQAEKLNNCPQIADILHNQAMVQKAKSALLNITDKVDRTDLEFDGGVATLSGLVGSAATKEKCEQMLMSMQGVESVNNELNIRDKNKSVF